MKVIRKKEPIKPFLPVTLTLVIETASELVELHNYLGKSNIAYALYRELSEARKERGI